MYLAVDIGGTKTLLAVFTAKGEIRASLKFPTPEKYPDFVKTLKEQIALLPIQVFVAAGIAVPGRLDPTRRIGVAFGNRPWLNVPIADDLEKILDCPFVMHNDTKLAGLSEAILIKDDFNKVLYVTISTGISSGLIINGIIDPELADSETGQIWLEHNGKLQRWETFASGKAIVKKYGKRASEINDPAIWKDISHDIAIGLIDIIATIQPEVVVLGGGVGTHYEKYKVPLQKELDKLEVPLVPIPPIRRAQRPEEAVIYGCYYLAKRHAEAS